MQREDLLLDLLTIGDKPVYWRFGMETGTINVSRQAAGERLGSVDRCEVAYATLRAEGCSVRPVVLAVALLPDDCDDYRRPCSCGCCH